MRKNKEHDGFSESVGNYLKTIYKLQGTEGTVSTTEIADELNHTGASVTGMLKRLATWKSDKGELIPLVDYNSYKGVRLTPLGVAEALKILRSHRLIELFLSKNLNFSLAKVHDEACRLEHVVSDDFIERIDEILGYPQYSPLGNPIPTSGGVMPESIANALAFSELNQEYVIKRISDDDQEMVAYFEQTGFLPGLKIKLLARSPFNGPLTIQYDSKEEIIGHELARNIFVAPTN